MGFPSCTSVFSHSLLNYLILPSHHISGCSTVGQKLLQLHLPALPCCALQPQTNICFLPSCAKEGTSVSRPSLFPPCFLCHPLFSKQSNHQKAFLQGYVIMFKAKAHMNHRLVKALMSTTSIFCFWKKGLSTAWSPLGAEESNYRLEILIIRK